MRETRCYHACFSRSVDWCGWPSLTLLGPCAFWANFAGCRCWIFGVVGLRITVFLPLVAGSFQPFYCRRPALCKKISALSGPFFKWSGWEYLVILILVGILNTRIERIIGSLGGMRGCLPLWNSIGKKGNLRLLLGAKGRVFVACLFLVWNYCLMSRRVVFQLCFGFYFVEQAYEILSVMWSIICGLWSRE